MSEVLTNSREGVVLDLMPHHPVLDAELLGQIFDLFHAHIPTGRKPLSQTSGWCQKLGGERSTRTLLIGGCTCDKRDIGSRPCQILEERATQVEAMRCLGPLPQNKPWTAPVIDSHHGSEIAIREAVLEDDSRRIETEKPFETA